VPKAQKLKAFGGKRRKGILLLTIASFATLGLQAQTSNSSNNNGASNSSSSSENVSPRDWPRDTVWTYWIRRIRHERPSAIKTNSKL
jgi:hypothetical protein